MNENYLAYKLKDYVSSGILPMHMPGHKRKVPKEIYNAMRDIYSMDLTEVEGTDNLHDATGIIRESMDFAKSVYKSDESFYLINGSSCGILASIKAGLEAASYKKTKSYIIIADNAHFSVFNAVELMGITPIYIETEFDELGIAKECNKLILKEILKNNIEKNIVAAVLTSPTYEGVASDICDIAKILHEYNIPLIVDEAHGAHLVYIEKNIKKQYDIKESDVDGNMKFPISALNLGADIVVQSLHKSLPSLTQTAICHIKSKLIEKRYLEEALHIFETSSPSYIFLASIDACIRYMAKNNENISKYLRNLGEFRKNVGKCEHIHIWQGFGRYGYDFTKLVIYSDLLDGIVLGKILREVYNIETEMSREGFVLAYSTVCDEKEDFNRLLEALKNIDKEFAQEYKPENRSPGLDEKYLGTEAEKNIYIYPPGVPLVKKGNIIDREKFDIIDKYIKKGKRIFGLDL